MECVAGACQVHSDAAKRTEGKHRRESSPQGPPEKPNNPRGAPVHAPLHASVTEGQPPWTSIAAVAARQGRSLGERCHIVWALSKDFALSGLRVGALYTENEAIRTPIQKLNDLAQVGSTTQVRNHICICNHIL